MASTVAVWTEHENKTIHDGTTETSDIDCTMIMYRTIGSKYITGIYLPSLLLKNASNFPQWNNEYQSLTSNGQNTGFQTGAITNWTVKSTLQNSSPATNRLLLAGTTSNKITTTDYKSTLANFGNTSFSIGPGLQVATGTGTLHANVASDKLAEMTVNNFSNFVTIYKWDPNVLNDYKDEITTFNVLWSGGATNSNTFTLKETPGLEFNTTHWGTGQGDGIQLIDIGIFDGTKCVGINTGQVTNLPDITWTDTSTKSRWDPNTWGGDTADIAFPTNQGETGFSPGNAASCYIRLNNTNLANTNSNVVVGNYILKVNMTGWSFREEIISVQRNFSLSNMSISFTASPRKPSLADESKGSRVNLLWNVNGGLNRVYQQTDATYLANTSGTSNVIFTENIRRLRTDTATASQDVLYLGDGSANAISILPEKIMTNSNRTIDDNYGLWFNASYTYYMDAYNVITGDTNNNDTVKTATVTTGPGTPINWQEAQVAEASTNPSIQMEWENPPATGTAATIRYNITRTTYNGSGVDISDNVTQHNFSNFNALTVSNLTVLNYTTTPDETLLYGKSFSYQLQATATGTSQTITKSFTVPDDSGTDASLNYTIDVSQNAVGTIYQTSDYEDPPRNFTYQNNYFVITVPTDYRFSDNTQPTEYQIFEKYKLIATIPKTKVDASGNQIIFSRYWLNGNDTTITDKYNTGVFFNVVAANPTAGKYSAIGDTKYAKTLAQPKLPYPMPVTKMTATGFLNEITLNWSLPKNSINSSEPTTYNYINKIHIYAIINPDATNGHYDHATDTSYNFGDGPEAANDISGSLYVLKATQNSNTTTWSTTRNLWDNEIVGYRIVTQNSQGLYSGQDPNDPTSGNLLWGTTQDISGVSYREAVASQEFYEFNNTYVQAKTSAPSPATGVNIGGSTDTNKIISNWSPQGTYSNDSPLLYSASYVYNSILGAGDLIPSDGNNGILIAEPTSTATGVNWTTNMNISGLVPGSQYTVSVSVYTNMQETHAADNNWTVGVDSPQTKTYTTTENPVKTSNYAVTGVVNADSVASGFDIPVEVGHHVYQGDFVDNNLTWKVRQYNAFEWALAGDGVTRTTPVHMISIWRFSSQGVNKGTKMTFEPSDSLVIDGHTMVNGDVIAVYDVQNVWCVDSYVWDNTSNDATRALLCDNEKLGGEGFMFQLWKSTEKTVHTLYVTSYDLDETPGGGNYSFNVLDQLTTINGGTSAAEYKNLKFAMADTNYKIYHKGVYKTTVTNALTYDTTTLADLVNNNYDVTWYYSVQSGHSPKSSTAFTSESQKWTTDTVTGELVELPRVITISNPIKSRVVYDANDTSDLVLGNSGTQSFTFNSGEWYRVSFYVVNTALTTVRTLFKTIPNLGSNDSILINNFTSDSFKYNYLEPSGRESGWTASDDEDINYDLGYDIKIVTDDGLSRSWTISGKQIQGINQKYLQGWSNMGHPYSQAKTGQHVLIDKKSASNVNIYSKLVIIWSPSNNSVSGPYYPVFYDPNTSLPRTTPDYSKVDTTNYIYGSSTIGVMNFDPGSYYKLRMGAELIILIGSLQARRNKGDFNNDDSVDINDAYSLAKYLVEINPEYNEIAGAIISESADKDNHNWANLKSDTGSIDGNNLINPDLRDLVYLISHIDQVTGYTSL